MKTGLYITAFLFLLVGCRGKNWESAQAIQAELNEEAKRMKRRFLQAAGGGNVEACRELLAKGVDVNTKDEKGETALHKASLSGKEQLVRLLLNSAADSTATDNQGCSPLHRVAQKPGFGVPHDPGGHLKSAELLVKRGISLDLKDDRARTPLHHSILSNFTAFTKYLISKGANINALDDDGCTPLDLALNKSMISTAVLLHKHGGRTEKRTSETLPQAASYGNIDKVKELLCAGADVNSRDKNWQTALSHALHLGNRELVELLIANGADINILHEPQTINRAAMKGYKDIVELLISYGADVNAVDRGNSAWGITPLQMAVSFGHKEIVELLIAEGSEVNLKDDGGETALDKTFHVEIKEFLRKHSAKTGKELQEENK